MRFSDTAKRRTLLTGLLDFRADLHTVGVLQGFQWINGSFVEDTTYHSQHDPNDIDVVTFLRLPSGHTQARLNDDNPSLFNPGATRRLYGLDAYTVVLDAGSLPELVRKVVYWNSLWSHDRSQQWKGYLEIDMSDSEDATARAALNEAFVREVEG